MKKERESNFELLRCLLMLMVISLHYMNVNMGGALKYSVGLNYHIALFLESFSVCAVNGFILLSGYFFAYSNKRKLNKPLNLIFAVIGYSVFLYVCESLLGFSSLSLAGIAGKLIPANYFVILYIVIYLISPYLNILLERLNKKQYEFMLVMFLLLFSVWPTVCDIFLEVVGKEIAGISTITAFGSAQGYTIVNFCIMYLIGGYFRKWYIIKRHIFNYIFAYIINTILIYALSLFFETAWYYSNFLVVFQAILIFLIFKELPAFKSKIINLVSSTTFGIFLIHTNPLLWKYFWSIFNIKTYANSNAFLFLLNYLCAIISMFIICSVLDYLLKKIVLSFSSLFNRIKFYNFEYYVK